MSDIHALSGAYATDALDDLERQAFERHLTGCPTCRSEADDLSETAVLLAETCRLDAPSALRESVLAQIAATRPMAPIVAVPVTRLDERRSHRRPRRWSAMAAAAAAVVAVGIGGAVVVDQVRGDDSSTVLSAVDQVMQAPDAQTFTQDATGGGTITVVRSATLNQAVLKTDDLAPISTDQTRELWLQHGSEYLPAGYLPDGTDHTVLLDGDPASAKGFGMTIEPASGSTTPSDDFVAVLPFTSA